MGIEKEGLTLEETEQIIDLAMPSLVEEELPVTTSPAMLATPEEIPVVRISYRVKYQTNPDYIPSMSGNKYENVNTQVECEETLHPDIHMFLCQ